MSPGQRVLGRVTQGDGCWVYDGTPSQPYGVVWDSQRRNNVPAHVAVYEHLVGPVPGGKDLHHTCEVKRCVRPDHLKPVTARQHAEEHQRGACIHGHPFTPENTAMRRGHRICRTCEADTRRRHRAANRDAINQRRRETRAQRTECRNGHPFTEANTFKDSLGRPHCRLCRTKEV